MTTLFLVLFLYCLGERLFEIYLSSRNRRLMREQQFVERETHPQLTPMIALHTTWLVATLGETLYRQTPPPLAISLVAAVAFVAAQVLRVWTLRTLGDLWNISIMTSSKDTPTFVSSGPYRYLRHPNYLTVIVELVTLPLVGGAWLTAILATAANGFMLAKRIQREEQALFAIPGYAACMGDKPRLFPFLWDRNR